MRYFALRASVLFFVTTAGWSTAARAQSGWFWQNPLPQGNELRAVAALSPRVTVAVGDVGTIVRTTDAGATWTLQDSGTRLDLRGVSFVDANIGIGTAVGRSGTILRTTDGGATWMPQLSGTTVILNGVSFVNANIGWAVGAFEYTGLGVIVHTTDGGDTWTPEYAPSKWTLLSVSFVNPCTGIAVGSYGTIIRTDTGGM